MGKRRERGTGSIYQRNGRGPWVASWRDHDGTRREKSTRTPDRTAALRILAKFVADAALRREGVIDASRADAAKQARGAIAPHIAAYVAHCEHAGHAPRHIHQKRMHLHRLSSTAGVTKLGDLTRAALDAYMRQLRGAGLSARTANFARQIAVAFASWCVETGRLMANPLSGAAKLDESRDRRRVRRPLTDDEIERLLSTTRPLGRADWYLAAALAGLRKGDLSRLEWRDIDTEAGTLTIRQGKGGRDDLLPLHPMLADALAARRTRTRPAASSRVFPTTVTDRTRQKDFLRAGLARAVPVLDDVGEPVMIGKGKRRRPKTRIDAVDEAGRVIDLHALRTTLGTKLARAGVAPQVAQQIMRHSDYRTTLRHYTVLGLGDTAKAMSALGEAWNPQPMPQLNSAESVPIAADVAPHQPRKANLTRITASTNDPHEPLQSRHPRCYDLPHHAGVAQLVERQLPKLNDCAVNGDSTQPYNDDGDGPSQCDGVSELAIAADALARAILALPDDQRRLVIALVEQLRAATD